MNNVMIESDEPPAVVEAVASSRQQLQRRNGPTSGSAVVESPTGSTQRTKPADGVAAAAISENTAEPSSPIVEDNSAATNAMINTTTSNGGGVDDDSASAAAVGAAAGGIGGPQLPPRSQDAVEIPVETAAEDNDDGEEEEVDEDEDYEYEEDDDAPFVSGFLVSNTGNSFDDSNNNTAGATSSADAAAAGASSDKPATIEEDGDDTAASAATGGGGKWREPTREAVSMSLRAEKEKTGGKRRLAQDLYRIMNQDHRDAGFSLRPSQEDSMDKWTIELFQFDKDSNLAKDMKVLGIGSVQLEMTFPDGYPFEPPFVRVVTPRFKKQTGFVMNGALCMELLTKDGWNPINDIESVIVSIRSLLVVGDGRVEAATLMSEKKYKALLAAASEVDVAAAGANADDGPADGEGDDDNQGSKRQRKNSAGDSVAVAKPAAKAASSTSSSSFAGGSYSVTEAESAYSHLSDYHKKKGWDQSGWWARKG